LLTEQFGTQDLAGFGCEQQTLAIAAAGCILQYVKDTQRTALPHIRSLIAEQQQDSVIIDASSRRNLELDTKIERLYHETMDTRPSGGDSQSGRHLFGHLRQVGAKIETAGASDWVVYPHSGQYPDDEAYFLQFILHFFEASLRNHPELDEAAFENWLRKRREQVARGELIYIAHQMDFLVRI